MASVINNVIWAANVINRNNNENNNSVIMKNNQ